jgi:hypothetical protein
MILFVAIPVIHRATGDRPILGQALLFPNPPIGKFISAFNLVARSRRAPDEVVWKV